MDNKAATNSTAEVLAATATQAATDTVSVAAAHELPAEVSAEIPNDVSAESPEGIGSTLKKIVLAYFAGWSIYSPESLHLPEVDWHRLTHVTYAFADVDGASGRVRLMDAWADVQHTTYPVDASSNSPKGDDDLKGNLGALWTTKQKHRHLKIGLSVGGWKGSANFSAMARNKPTRASFIGSLLKTVIDFGLDYVDIDWEYPVIGGAQGNATSPDDGRNLLTLLTEFRAIADKGVARKRLQKRPDVLLAIPANAFALDNYPLPELMAVVDYFQVMAYDFGSVEDSKTMTDHHANLQRRPASNTVIVQNDKLEWEANIKGQWNGQSSLRGTIEYLLKKRGVPAEKIIAGVPFYGRIMEPSAGLATPFPDKPTHRSDIPLKEDFIQRILQRHRIASPKKTESTAIDTQGELQADAKLISYRDLFKRMQSGKMHSYWEPACSAEYAVNSSEPWNAKTKSFISYESPRSLETKLQFIKEAGLAGVMAWELSMDLEPKDELSLLSIIHRNLSSEGLADDENCLCYPHSRFSNVRSVNCSTVELKIASADEELDSLLVSHEEALAREAAEIEAARLIIAEEESRRIAEAEAAKAAEKANLSVALEGATSEASTATLQARKPASRPVDSAPNKPSLNTPLKLNPLIRPEELNHPVAERNNSNSKETACS